MLLHQQRASASEPATSAADLIGKRTLTSRLASTARAPIERGTASPPSVVDVATDGVGDAPGPLPSSPSAVDGLTDQRLLQRPWLTGAANDEAVGDAPAPAATTAPANTAAPATPSNSGAAPPQVLARVGQTFTHYGYTYLVTPEGHFTMQSSPTGKGVGTTFKPTGSSAKAWKVLSDYLVAQAPAQPAATTSPAPAGAPAPATSGWSVDGVVAAITAGLSALGDAVMGGVAVIEQTLTALLGDDAAAAPTPADHEAEPAPGEGAGAPSQTAPAAPAPGGDVAPPAPGALPFVVGGQPSSRAAGTTYPNYGGSAVGDDPGMATNPGVKLTSQIVRAAKVLAPYLPDGVILTSGWRTDEEQAALIIRFGGGSLVDGDLSKTFDAARKAKQIAWPGDSKHRPGLAFDTSGADLSTIKAAVEKCVAEHPDAGIDLGACILETSNNCFHVAVTA